MAFGGTKSPSRQQRKAMVFSPLPTKEEVDYRSGNEQNGEACKYCTFFRAPSACQRIEGSIGPLGLCDLFQRENIKHMVLSQLIQG
jgi:hypothetical protein